MNRLRIVSLMVFVCCVILCASTITTQAATLNITVTDAQTGNQLKNVSVTVKPQTGDSTKGMTDDSGTIELSDFAAGVYTITVNASGYSDNVMTNIEITEDETKSLDITLSSDVIELDKVSVVRKKCLKPPHR